jgi:hypothetical protein
LPNEHAGILPQIQTILPKYSGASRLAPLFSDLPKRRN